MKQIKIICTQYWCVDKKFINIIKKSFKMISPNCVFEIKKFDDNMISFRVKWKENEINPIVFNKIIFPDFSIIPKENLEF
jgi:hypothetical protein